MQFVRELSIGNALIKVVVKLHESSSPDDLLRLVTKGDEKHMMAAMNWFRRRKLTIEAFPGYFFKKIADAVVQSTQANKRFITSPNMEIVVLVDAPMSMAQTAMGESSIDALARYVPDMSSPSYVFIAFFPTEDFFAGFVQKESEVFRIMTHEMQHHAAMGYEKIMSAITNRSMELKSQGRMGYNSWIALAAFMELKNEGLPKFSEYSAKGAYLINFTALNAFVQQFERIPPIPRQVLNLNYYAQHIKHFAYDGGAVMFITILAKRLLLKRIFSYIMPVGTKEVIPLQKLKFYYGVRDLYLVAPNAARVSPNDTRTENHQLRMMNEAKALIMEMQDKSHLYFLSVYEDACRFLGVKPLISRDLYVKVKLACHINFLNLLASRGVSLDVAA